MVVKDMEILKIRLRKRVDLQIYKKSRFPVVYSYRNQVKDKEK